MGQRTPDGLRPVLIAVIVALEQIGEEDQLEHQQQQRHLQYDQNP